MKGLRIFAIILGSVVVLLALAAILALTPAVQTWAARKALADQPGGNIQIGRVAAGPTAANLTDIRIVREGTVITIERVSANYSAWDYLTKEKINAENVVAENVVIDLRRTGETAAASAAATQPSSPRSDADHASTPSNESPSDFNGVLEQAKLPFDIRVANLAANGRALLPQTRVLSFDVKARGIETGQRGTLEWTADLADPAPTAPLKTLRTSGAVGIHISTDRRIDAFTLETTVSAEGPDLPSDRIKLEAHAEQPAAGGNETYRASIGLVRDSFVEPLLHADGRYDAAAREVVGAWKLAVRTQQLAALLTGLGLPEVAAHGAGNFRLDPNTSAMAADGKVNASITRLEAVSPQLVAIGSLQLQTSFAGDFANGIARLERLQLDATGAEGQRFAQIETTQHVEFDTATQRVSLASPHAELARIALRSLPLAWAQPFVPDLTLASGELSMVLAVDAEADGSRVRARAIEPFALRNVTIADGDKTLLDRVTLTAQPRIDYSAAKLVADFAELDVSMPAGDSLTGSAAAEITDLTGEPAISFSSQLQATLVAALQPYLPLDPGPLAVAASVSGRLQGDTLQLARFSSSVTRVNGPPIANVDLQQPMTANLAAKTFALERPQSPVAHVQLGEIPLSWAQAFVPDAQFSGNVAGSRLEVTLPSLENITVKTVQPLLARAVNATVDGEALVRDLDFAVDFTATKEGETIAYEVRRLELKQDDTSIATLAVSGEARLGETPAVTAKGTLDADLAALVRQPLAASFATIAQGRVASTFDAQLADSIQAKVTLTARNLVARDGNRPLGDLEASLTATMKEDSSGTLVAPITLSNGARRSDLSIHAAFGKQPDQDAFLLTGEIASNQLFVDDFQPLAGLAPTSETETETPARAPSPRPPSAPPAALPPSTRDNEPFWNAVRGKLAVDLKQVVYGKDYRIGNVRGSVTIEDRRLALDGLEGLFNQNPFRAAATVTFAAQQPKPYTLAGSAQVQNFDVGAFLRATGSNQKPPLESKVTVTSDLNGYGATLGDLAKNIYGRFDLTGSQGVLRALGRTGEIIGLGSQLLSLAGGANNSDTTAAFGQLASMLGELRFDAFKMQIERGADLSIKLSNIEFVSPLIHLTGSGRVAHQAGASATQQPMEIFLQLGAKGELAHLLTRLNALGQLTDDRGYQLVQRTFTIGGTPANPDSNSLWKMLWQLASPTLIERGLPALQDLFRR